MAGTIFSTAQVKSIKRMRDQGVKPEVMGLVLDRTAKVMSWKLSTLDLGYPFGHWAKREVQDFGCLYCGEPIAIKGAQLCDNGECVPAFVADERAKIAADEEVVPAKEVVLCPICGEVNNTGYALHTKACLREHEARKRAERMKLMTPLVQEGLPILTIAARLEISPGSVKKLRREILDRRAA